MHAAILAPVPTSWQNTLREGIEPNGSGLEPKWLRNISMYVLPYIFFSASGEAILGTQRYIIKNKSTLHKHFIQALYTSTSSKHFTQALYQSTLHKHFIKALYTSTLSKHFIQALYPSTLHKHFIQALYKSTLSKHFIKALYQSTLSKHFLQALYQGISKQILEIPVKV